MIGFDGRKHTYLTHLPILKIFTLVDACENYAVYGLFAKAHKLVVRQLRNDGLCVGLVGIILYYFVSDIKLN